MHALFHKHIAKILMLLILTLGISNPANVPDKILSIMLCMYVLLFLSSCTFNSNFIKLFKRHSNFIIIPVVLIFITSSFINSVDLRNYLVKEPIPETYRTDMDDFLRTYYLMEKGNGYYASFRQAVEENAFKTQVSTNIWSWRFPYIFYLWKILPGQSGVNIFYIFILSCCLSLFLAYKLAYTLLDEKIKIAAILAPYLLYPYLHFAARDPTLLQTEWWGMMPILGGLYLLVNKQNLFAAVSFTIVLLTRELFVIPLLIIAVSVAFQKNKRWKTLIIPGVWLIFASLIHAINVSYQVTLASGFLTPRIHTLGKQILLATLSFGSWEYLLYKMRIFVWFYASGLIGVIWLIIKKNFNGWLLISFFIFPLTFLVVGTSIYNDYWGILYMPFVLITVPLVLNLTK